MKLLYFIFLLLFSLPTAQAAAPILPKIAKTTRQSPPIEPKKASPQSRFSQLLHKHKKQKKAPDAIPDRLLIFLVLFVCAAAIGLSVVLALSFAGVFPAAWLLWSQLGFLFDFLLLLGLLFGSNGDPDIAFTAGIIGLIFILAFYGLGLLVGGAIAPAAWAIIAGSAIFLPVILVVITWFMTEKAKSKAKPKPRPKPAPEEPKIKHT